MIDPPALARKSHVPPGMIGLSILLSLFSGGMNAWARPEYAVKEKLNCVACHATPWGGGPRNAFGKAYGSRGLGLSKLSNSDLYYGDLRLIGYHPLSEVAQRMSGLALMEFAATANLPVTTGEDGAEMRVVGTYNMPSLGTPGPREAYVRWLLPSKDALQGTYFTLGRFYVPFGLLTDEHRTYTRIQTNMTENNFDVGGALSTNPWSLFHIDLALVSSFQGGGVFTSGDISYGVVLNLRYDPTDLPFFVGGSANYEYLINEPQPVAGSLYTAWSLDRLTKDKAHGSVLLEGVLAKNWNNPVVNPGEQNPGLSQFFLPSTPPAQAYLSANLKSYSAGVYNQIKYELTKQWVPFFKFDYLTLDAAHPGDGFYRYGLGLEAFLNSNLILNARIEKAVTPGFVPSESGVLSVQDDIFAMLRLWI